MSSVDSIPEVLPEVKAAYWFPDGASPGSDDCAQKIASNLFTHLFCAFADIDFETHKVFVPLAHESIFSNFTRDVRKKNTKVKTLLSIGGKNANHNAFVSMASYHKTRKVFIDSSISIARSMNFNGLDLAWEYPNSSTEMTNFGKLLEEWHLAIEDERSISGQPCLLLTASVYYSPSYKSLTYPVDIMKKSLNWVNIIAYDFYTPATSDDVTTPTAALYDSYGKGRLNGDSSKKKWFEAVLPRNRVVFGLSYVGWAFTLLDAEQHGYNATTLGPAISGDGSINYDLIQQFIDDGANQVYNKDVVEDYCYAGKTWIAFQGEQTVITKVNYAKVKGLLGYFAWNVTADVDYVLSTAASKAWDVPHNK